MRALRPAAAALWLCLTWPADGAVAVEIKGKVTNALTEEQYRRVEVVVTDRLGVELGRARPNTRGQYELELGMTLAAQQQNDAGGDLRARQRSLERDRCAEGPAQPALRKWYTADHSYDFRIHDGKKGQPLIPPTTPPEFGDDMESITLGGVRREDEHTGEQVLVAAIGPGAERVRGFLANTDLFHVMMAAFGWKQ